MDPRHIAKRESEEKEVEARVRAKLTVMTKEEKLARLKELVDKNRQAASYGLMGTFSPACLGFVGDEHTESDFLRYEFPNECLALCTSWEVWGTKTGQL